MSEPVLRLTAAALARRLGPPPGGSGPAYRLLAHRIRSAVLDGRLASGSGLPSERELGVGLSLSRTTVAAAYALLRDDGWLESRRGSGSRLRLPGISSADPVRPAGGIGPAGLFGRPAPSVPDTIDLTVASLPAPADALRRAAEAAVEDLPRYATADGYAPFGLPVLRQAIADHYTAAGLPTSADQILVTNGAQHGFSLALHELSAPGDRVLVECPTYPVALDAIRAAGRVPDPVGLPGPDAGAAADAPWDVELIAAVLRQTAPRLAYLMPDFQNPTGALMDADTRASIVRSARAAGTVLLVDESLRDVPFPSCPPLPPHLAGCGSPGTVLSLGSLSKAVWGGLRVGWVRGAPALINRLAVARALGDMAGPVLEQLIAVYFLADPWPGLEVQRRRLADGAAVLTAALAAQLPDWQVSRPLGGASLWVALPGPWASALAGLAPSVGVRIAPGPRFGPDGTLESYLRLPFTAPTDTLVAGVRRLAAIAPQAAGAVRAELPGWLA